jgi:hypothetical protein
MEWSALFEMLDVVCEILDVQIALSPHRSLSQSTLTKFPSPTSLIHTFPTKILYM